MNEQNPDLKEMQNAINSLTQKKKEIDDLALKIFNETIEKAFDIYPDLKFIQFAGHTPHFNDGDACVFHLYDCVCSKKEVDYSYYGDLQDGNYYDDDEYRIVELEELFNSIRYLISPIFQNIYGDGVQVKFTKENGLIMAAVDEYDHD